MSLTYRLFIRCEPPTNSTAPSTATGTLIRIVVEYADRLFREQGVSLMDAAIGAAKLRVRPIIMTAFAFILGVMPLVFASGVYATARNIMGVALVGGMLFATLLGIFVYPALYYFVGKIGRFEQRRELKKQEENA